MKSFIKNTNLNKQSPSSWSKVIIFTFTSFLILHLISNSHITRACASVIFDQQQQNANQQEQPALDGKNTNTNNNYNKDVVNNPKATPNDLDTNDSQNTNFSSSNSSTEPTANVPKQEPPTHPKTDHIDINKTEPLGPKLTKNDDQDSNILRINDETLPKFTAQYDSASSSELNLNIKVSEPPTPKTPQLQTPPTPLETLIPTPSKETTASGETVKSEDLNNKTSVPSSNVDEKQAENPTLIKPNLSNETVSEKNETVDSLLPPKESINDEANLKNTKIQSDIPTNKLENLTNQATESKKELNDLKNEKPPSETKKDIELSKEENQKLSETEIKDKNNGLPEEKVDLEKAEQVDDLKEENLRLYEIEKENKLKETEKINKEVKENVEIQPSKDKTSFNSSEEANLMTSSNSSSNITNDDAKLDKVEKIVENITRLETNEKVESLAATSEKQIDINSPHIPRDNHENEQQTSTPTTPTTYTSEQGSIKSESVLNEEILASSTTTIQTPYYNIDQNLVPRMKTKNDDHKQENELKQETVESTSSSTSTIAREDEEKLLIKQDDVQSITSIETDILVSTPDTILSANQDHDHDHDHNQDHGHDHDHTISRENIQETSITQNNVEDSTESNKLNQHAETLSSILRSATIHSKDSTAKETVSTPPSSTSDETVQNETDDGHLEKETIKYLKTPPNFKRNSFPSKYCADIRPIRDLFNNHIEPIYHPFISMLPEDMQVMLLDETSFGGLSFASCLLISAIIGFISLAWLILIKKQQNLESNATKNINETILMLNNRITNLEFEKQTFESEVNDLYDQVSTHESCLTEKDEKLNESLERLAQVKKSADSYFKELEKLRGSEAKCVKELNQYKLEYNDLSERFTQQSSENDAKINYLNEEYNQKLNNLMNELSSKSEELSQCKHDLNEKTSSLELYRENEIQLNNLIEQHEKKILILQNSLLRDKKHSSSNNSLDMNVARDDEYVKINSEDLNSADLNSIMKNAELQMDIKNLEDKLSETMANYDVKVNECLSLMAQLEEKEKYCEQFKLRQEQLERNVKDSEIKIKVLNELREKDTKQHVKSLTELDVQLKKKTTDAEKVSHLLDQLRVKQERIHELESQFARIEKQSSQERQTFEKQAHENWLNAKRIDKELKETRNETIVLKEKLTELESINKSLIERQNGLGPGIMPNTRYYMLQQANLMAQQQQQQQQQNNSNPSSNKLSNDSSPKIPAYDDPQQQQQQQQQHQHHQRSSSNQSFQHNDGTNDSINGDVPPTKQADFPLEVDTNQQLLQQQRPPSTTSNLNYPQAPFPFNQMRAPFRYPFPPMMPPFMQQPQQMQQQMQQQPLDQRNSTPSPSFSAFQSPHQQMLFRMQLQQQYTLQQQQQQQMTRSGASSQQPSPGGNSLNHSQLQTSLPYSTSFVLNNSSLSNLNESSNSNMNSPRDVMTNINTLNSTSKSKPYESDNSALSAATVGQSKDEEPIENVNSFNV